MNVAELLDRIAAKGSDKTAIADEWIAQQADLAPLLDGLGSPKGDVKFGCEKVLRRVAEAAPALLDPHIERLASFLERDNKILQWGVVFSLSHWAAADRRNRFAPLFERYFRLIRGTDMIAAANVVRGSVRIARAHPEWADRILAEILRVEHARYKTPECVNVAIGHALDALDEIYPLFTDPRPARDFIQRQLDNPRPAVARRAQRLWKRCAATAAHSPPAGEDNTTAAPSPPKSSRGRPPRSRLRA